MFPSRSRWREPATYVRDEGIHHLRKLRRKRTLEILETLGRTWSNGQTHHTPSYWLIRITSDPMTKWCRAAWNHQLDFSGALMVWKVDLQLSIHLYRIVAVFLNISVITRQSLQWKPPSVPALNTPDTFEALAPHSHGAKWSQQVTAGGPTRWSPGPRRAPVHVAGGSPRRPRNTSNLPRLLVWRGFTIWCWGYGDHKNNIDQHREMFWFYVVLSFKYPDWKISFIQTGRYILSDMISIEIHRSLVFCSHFTNLTTSRLRWTRQLLHAVTSDCHSDCSPLGPVQRPGDLVSTQDMGDIG